MYMVMGNCNTNKLKLNTLRNEVKQFLLRPNPCLYILHKLMKTGNESFCVLGNQYLCGNLKDPTHKCESPQ